MFPISHRLNLLFATYSLSPIHHKIVSSGESLFKEATFRWCSQARVKPLKMEQGNAFLDVPSFRVVGQMAISHSSTASRIKSFTSPKNYIVHTQQADTQKEQSRRALDHKRLLIHFVNFFSTQFFVVCDCTRAPNFTCKQFLGASKYFVNKKLIVPILSHSQRVNKPYIIANQYAISFVHNGKS